MKKIVFCFLALTAVLMAGCIRPPNYPGMVQIQTNEIAFLVDMTGDGVVSASNTEIQRKDIPIPGYFVRTGRFDHQGYWRPMTKVIVVSQAPVRMDWDEHSDTRTVRMTSIESSGFVIPMMLNAYIANRNDATKYLAAFRPVSNETIDWIKIEQRDWSNYAKEEAQPLATAMNTVIYTKIMEQLAVLFVKTPILNAEAASKIYIPALYEGCSAAELRSRVKSTIGTDITFTQDVPSLKEWALETYGITITAMAPGDGVLYDNSDVQKQIDALAAGVMREKTLIQDQVNAQREAQVNKTRADGEAAVARAKADQASALMRLQEVENSKLLAEATSAAIRDGKVVPAGSYPVGLNSLIITPNYNSFR